MNLENTLNIYLRYKMIGNIGESYYITTKKPFSTWIFQKMSQVHLSTSLNMLTLVESNFTSLYGSSSPRKQCLSIPSVRQREAKVVVKSLINCYPEVNVYRFKSDNCGEQYKCSNVFFNFLPARHET